MNSVLPNQELDMSSSKIEETPDYWDEKLYKEMYTETYTKTLPSYSHLQDVQVTLDHFKKAIKHGPVFVWDSMDSVENLHSTRISNMSASTIRDEKLDFWLQHSFNVLFVGKHGVGKTSMVQACFERAGLILGESYLYFSAATLDPWVDLVGVPKEVKNEDGSSYLELVRPKALASGNIQAMFFDEYNRSSAKIRNAVLELIQFHSINGKKFSNLKVVWAAVNPDGEDGYDVEKIDPAQEDRFHVKIEVPYKPSLTWFTTHFGKALAKAAIEWWQALPEEEKKHVSPRRLEYALRMYKLGEDLKDVVPVSSNASALLTALRTEPVSDVLQRHYEAKDSGAGYLYLSDENNYHSAMALILKDTDWMHFYLPVVSKEHLITLIASNQRVASFIIQNESKHERFTDVLNEVLKANTNRDLQKRIREEMTTHRAKVKEVPETPQDIIPINNLDKFKDKYGIKKTLGKDGKAGVWTDKEDKPVKWKDKDPGKWGGND